MKTLIISGVFLAVSVIGLLSVCQRQLSAGDVIIIDRLGHSIKMVDVYEIAYSKNGKIQRVRVGE